MATRLCCSGKIRLNSYVPNLSIAVGIYLTAFSAATLQRPAHLSPTFSLPGVSFGFSPATTGRAMPSGAAPLHLPTYGKELRCELASIPLNKFSLQWIDSVYGHILCVTMLYGWPLCLGLVKDWNEERRLAVT